MKRSTNEKVDKRKDRQLQNRKVRDYTTYFLIISKVLIESFGQTWPSSGLMSTWAAAHEMAHK
jgi:hypothetical protein